jgi:hypothetical protein
VVSNRHRVQITIDIIIIIIMSRKQSTVERIRKKKAAVPPPSPYDDDADPFHNGQTPACRLLLDAIQDIFPELQQQMKHQTDSSELGQLLRWQILKRRKERTFPPAPPLLSFSPQSTKTKELSEDASKKKRKRKKKKKETGGASADLKLETSESIESDLGGEKDDVTTGALNQIPKEEKIPVVSAPVNADSSDDDVDIMIPLKDESTRSFEFEPSVQLLDRSIHELEEERMMLEYAVTPTLHHLPSDDGSVDDFLEAGHSSMAFFEQIHEESTERDDDDDDSADYDITLSIPLDSPLEPARTPPGNNNRPRLRARAFV